MQSGNHQFQAIVNLLDNGTANITSDSTLTFNNALNLNGNTLIKTGEGTMEINNTLNTGGGTVNLLQGTLSGGGSVGGDVVIEGGTISPGNQNVQANSLVPEPATCLLLGVGLLMTTLGSIRKMPSQSRSGGVR